MENSTHPATIFHICMYVCVSHYHIYVLCVYIWIYYIHISNLLFEVSSRIAILRKSNFGILCYNKYNGEKYLKASHFTTQSSYMQFLHHWPFGFFSTRTMTLMLKSWESLWCSITKHAAQTQPALAVSLLHTWVILFPQVFLFPF